MLDYPIKTRCTTYYGHHIVIFCGWHVLQFCTSKRWVWTCINTNLMHCFPMSYRHCSDQGLLTMSVRMDQKVECTLNPQDYLTWIYFAIRNHVHFSFRLLVCVSSSFQKAMLQSLLPNIWILCGCYTEIIILIGVNFADIYLSGFSFNKSMKQQGEYHGLCWPWLQ